MKEIDNMIVKTENSTPHKGAPGKVSSFLARQRSREDLAREQLNQLISGAVSRINSDAASLRQYLDVQSQFPTFTVRNAILVLSQNADATDLADEQTWKDKGFLVRRGETGVQIFGPGVSYTKADGSLGSVPSIRNLFDVRQTTAIPTPVPAVHYDQRLLLKAILRTAPCKVDASDHISEKRKACYNMEHDTIFIHPGMTAAQLFQTLAEQISMRIAFNRGLQEHQRIQLGYCASYILCRRFGVAVPEHGIDVVPEWFSSLSEGQVIHELSNARLIVEQMAKQMEDTLKLRRAAPFPEKETAERGGG